MQQTNNLHTILLYAQQEAQRLGNTEILPDHLVLGILRLADGKAFELLMQAGLNPVELKRAIDERLMQASTSETAKMSRASERILRLMLIEANAYHAEECGSVHLLLGILRERVNYPAMFVEQQFGIDYERIEGLYPKPQPLPQDGSTLDSEFAGEQPLGWGGNKAIGEKQRPARRAHLPWTNMGVI